jgi:hypothetical protein
MKKPNLSNFGGKLKLNARAGGKKKKTITEKDLFLETVDLFFETWNRSNKVYENFKVNLLEYEENFYQIIENCLSLKYDPWKVEIILWYVFGRIDENDKIIPLFVQFDDKEPEEIFVKTSQELWDFLKKLEEKENEK